ncbi:hypothetical protein WUBG_05293 [Wuchereria bancrofti]|uniref:Uncharacterized protein n=1 Tax=Wuchereria bancrofti TaxID=6293 RepID=J9ENN2_WUCBA|nr:hypothetical protein WUBG_05293 [Wuchereria bancrofti]
MHRVENTKPENVTPGVPKQENDRNENLSPSAGNFQIDRPLSSSLTVITHRVARQCPLFAQILSFAARIGLFILFHLTLVDNSLRNYQCDSLGERLISSNESRENFRQGSPTSSPQ